MALGYTWDPIKARRNQRAHGVSFDTATQVFADPYHVTVENDTLAHEQRELAIGMTIDRIALIVVVFVELGSEDPDDAIVLRIISARKASGYETAIYESQFQ